MPERLPYRIEFNSRLPWWVGHDCLTIGKTIYCRRRYMSRLIVAHEYRHVMHWAEMGARFPFAYLLEQLRHGYRANRFEIEAHEYSAAHSQEFEDVEAPK